MQAARALTVRLRLQFPDVSSKAFSFSLISSIKDVRPVRPRPAVPCVLAKPARDTEFVRLRLQRNSWPVPVSEYPAAEFMYPRRLFKLPPAALVGHERHSASSR